MDINAPRSLITVSGFILFMVLVVRVWRQRARSAHEAAAQLVFEGEPMPGAVRPQEQHNV